MNEKHFSMDGFHNEADASLSPTSQERCSYGPRESFQKRVILDEKEKEARKFVESLRDKSPEERVKLALEKATRLRRLFPF
jgi:hypothetical protein